ncbi:MAG: hypothetical protein Q4F65_11015 [Propionibacteriaceae bacterium]|nr:hypothetical protein [Propionibacteriaceae bacterium]
MSDLGESLIRRVHANLVGAKSELLKYRPNLAVGDGSIITPEGSDAGEPVMVLADVWRIGKMVRCEVIAGTYGDHDELVGDDVEPITDRAAGRRYRFDLYFPQSGDAGMLVAETCKRATPVEEFLRWLAWLDMRALKQSAESHAAENPEVSEAWIDPNEWRKFRAVQVADRDFLLQLI